MKRFLVVFICVCLCIVPVEASAFSVGAAAAIVINADTGEVIFEQNANTKLPMASTTKIMTALLLCESGGLDETLTVTDKMVRVEGSSMGLLAGDTVSKRDLLYGMMLASGNDAANVTAYLLGGTVDGFVKLMNQKAEVLELKNTHFETPSGLDGDSHYTTAYDLALLTKYALCNDDFAAAASSKSATLCYGNPPYRRTLTNHNKMLKNYEGCIGVKTGFTKKSGRCLVTAAKRQDETVIAVTLNCPDDWNTHRILLDYGFEKVESLEINPEKTQYPIPVISGKEDEIIINIDPFKTSKVTDDSFTATVNLPPFLYAPLKEGEQIGTVIYKKNNTILAEVPIKSTRTIEIEPIKKNYFEIIIDNVKLIFKNIWEN